MNEIIEGIKALNEPIVKLIEAIRAAIGKAYEPYHIKKIADVVRENNDLPIFYDKDGIQIDSTDYNELRKRTENRLAYQEIRKQENIEAVADRACDFLKDKTEMSDSPIDLDWMNRFINISGEISSKDMQELWAKLLAGEVLRPGTYSVKTLSILQNMSSDDARLFERVSKYVIADSFIISDDNLNRKHGIRYEDILNLDEAGIINSTGAVQKTFLEAGKPELLFDFEDCVLMAKSENKSEVRIKEYILSRAGRELLSVIRSSEDNKYLIPVDYRNGLINLIKRQNSSVKITLHEVVIRKGDKVSYKQEELQY